MLGDPWPEEPDEPLVERYKPDGENVPEPPRPDEIPADVRRTFWSVAGTTNVGLLAVSLGVMLVVFRGEVVVGGGLVAVGIGALLWAYYKYRRFRGRNP